MMQKTLQKQAPQLRISYQNETAILRRTVAKLQLELLELKKTINTIYKTNKKIILSSNGQHHYILLNDIIYCVADGNYTQVYIKQKTNLQSKKCRCILISKTLKSTADLMDSEDFIRCHQSYLINKKHVTGFKSNNGLWLTLTNENTIPISRRNKTWVLNFLQQSNSTHNL